MKWIFAILMLFVCQASVAEPMAALQNIENYQSVLARAEQGIDAKAQLRLAQIAYECSSTKDAQLIQACKSIEFNTAEDGYRWLVEAAENGSVDAQVAHARSVVPGVDMSIPDNRVEYFKRANQFREEAIESGSPEAIFLESNAILVNSGSTTDKTEAYAWVLASIECGFDNPSAFKAKYVYETTREIDAKAGTKRAREIAKQYCTGK